ncbi:MAG TPA: glycosyltransferase [Steroidobacteraceae bacterium]|nr:glycosyltransferase [Steroidobacteraceae bacterium]
MKLSTEKRLARELSVLSLQRVDEGAAETSPQVAVLIPCYNEAITIAEVIRDFACHLPHARIYVCDNNSTDGTAEVAAAAGAQVFHETRQGKGNVVRRMFADVQADVYVLVDGDGTYDAASAPRLIDFLQRGSLDLVNAARVPVSANAFPGGHSFGNLGFSRLIAAVFGKQIGDVLSGYRVMSHRFVKSFPALSRGFETETELVVHALELRLPIGELNTPYSERPDGSLSKLHTLRDGTRILRTILALIKDERPMAFFCTIGALLAITSIVLGAPLVTHYFHTGLVPRLPTAVLATGVMLLAFISVVAGLVLDTVTHGRRELKRLHYLSLTHFRNAAAR